MQFLTRLCLIDHKKKKEKLWSVKQQHVLLLPIEGPSFICTLSLWILASSILTAVFLVARLALLYSSWWSFFSFVHPLNVSFLAGKHNLLSAYNFMTLCLALAPEQKRNEAEMACHFHTLPSKPFMFGTPDLDQGVDWPIGILSIPWQAAFQELIIRQAVIYML